MPLLVYLACHLQAWAPVEELSKLAMERQRPLPTLKAAFPTSEVCTAPAQKALPFQHLAAC